MGFYKDGKWQPDATEIAAGECAEGRFRFETYQEWTEWFRPGLYNWFNFTIIKIGFENAPYKGVLVEIWTGLLGFNLIISVYENRKWRQYYEEPEQDRPEPTDEG